MHNNACRYAVNGRPSLKASRQSCASELKSFPLSQTFPTCRVALPLSYNVRNISCGGRATVATVLGVALVVAVYRPGANRWRGLEQSSRNTAIPQRHDRPQRLDRRSSSQIPAPIQAHRIHAPKSPTANKTGRWSRPTPWCWSICRGVPGMARRTFCFVACRRWALNSGRKLN